jgi:S-DNA-T family DNA segregation ATPase FtsK/SpoIIIE
MENDARMVDARACSSPGKDCLSVMILRLSVQDMSTGTSLDVEMTAEPESLVESLLFGLPIPIGGRPCFVGAERLDPRAAIADSPLVAGAVISVGAPGAAVVHPTVGALRVLSGPDAGTVSWFSPGRHAVHRGLSGTAVLTDPELSRLHAQLDVARDGRAAIRDLGSRNGTLVDGRNAVHPVPVTAESRLRLGASTLRWEPQHATGTRVAAQRGRDGRVYFDRAFAPAPAIIATRVQLPERDTTPRNVATLVVSAAVPIVLGALMAAVLRQPTMLLIALLGPITAVGAYLVERRQRTVREREFSTAKAAAEQQIGTAVAAEEDLRRRLAPDRAELTLVATGARRGLWPRNAGSTDGLTLRVGTADEAASIELQGTPWPGFETPTLRGVPATVDLRHTGVLGVVGPSGPVNDLMRWLLLQLGTLRSPDDLQLVVVAAQDDDTLAWTRWLPHLDAGDAVDAPCWIGNTAATRKARVKELSELVAARLKERGTSQVRYSEEIVAVFDGALALRHLPGMRDVLRDGPSVGVYAICADRNDMNECHGVCRLDDATSMTLNRSRDEHARPVRPEGLDAATAARLARALAPMRDRLTLAGAQTAIPFPVRQADLYDADIRTAAGVLDLWRRDPGPSTAVVLGADASGRVIADLARQGPHAMLGGATGAGKSVLLQTLVTALLLGNTPDELNLVLVDFKGGSAFLPFENCPHVVSLIRSTGETVADVFDAAAAGRMLASVRAEVRRRESLLSRYGGEIDEYWAARARDPRLAALPRLVMIFDEYARVLDVSPDFLKELVNVAGKGRSLGMHLVLATQSLTGKLSDELKNNISLRITLQQNDANQSNEVLGVPDAADIPRRLRGRGIMLTVGGDDARPRTFQSGYLGDPPPATGAAPATVRPVGWPAVGMRRPERVTTVSTAPTDLQLAVRAIIAAADRLGVTAPFRPLLPALPAILGLTEVSARTGFPATAAPYGLVDEPEAQAQPPAYLDLAGTERLMVAGGPQSGRTTFARTLIESLAHRFSPDRLHLYVFEHLPAGLDTYRDLPHCGGVFSPADRDRVRRLVTWLDAEVQRRTVARFLPDGSPEPAVLLVIDGWEHFENRGDPNFVETPLLGLLRGVVSAGPPVGVHVVAIGGQDMLAGKLPNQYSQRLLLPFPKEETRRTHLAGGMTSPLPVPGRAIDAASGRHLQICLPGPAPLQVLDGPGRRPQSFPPLPARVRLTDIPAAAPAPWIPVGVGGSDVTPIGIDLFTEGPPLLLVSGPAGSGRSTAAAAVTAALIRAGIPVLVLAARAALEARLPDDPNVRVLVGAAFQDTDLRAAAKGFAGDRYAVVMDDCQQTTVTPATEGFTDVPTLLEEIAGPAAFGRQALILCGDATPILDGQRRSLARVVAEVMTSGTRILLTPTSPMVARTHGFALDPDQYFAGPPGRGYLATGRTLQLIQLTTG